MINSAKEIVLSIEMTESMVNLEASRVASYTKIYKDMAFTEKGDDIFTGNLAIAYRINNRRTSQEIKLDIQNFTNITAKVDEWYNFTTD